MINKKEIGKQLKELRKSRDYTQIDVAERVGLSRPAVSNIESGRRALTLETLKRFCELYNIDISYFGIDTKNFSEKDDLIFRLQLLFNSDIPDTEKDALYRDIMQMYLDYKNKMPL